MSLSRHLPPSRRHLTVLLHWAVLLLLSTLLAALLEWFGLPAALLLGPMAAGAVLGVNGTTLRVPYLPYWAAQGIIGCMIAAAIHAEFVDLFLQRWPLFLAVVAAIVAASSTLGWLLSRSRILPGTTAIWGSSPGAASAMMLMAEAYGADARLVAFMQYLRVVFVAAAASLVARFWVDTSGAVLPPIVWFPPLEPTGLLVTVLIAFGGVVLGRLTRFPAGTLLLPMVLAALLNGFGLVELVLPEWLLALSYAVLGWSIGLGFTRPILRHAARALPQVVASILALMAFSAALAALLTWQLGIDPLTAYLATSPGGLDSVAIIAASSDVDLAFVMALQTVRFLLVLLLGPILARFIADRVQGHAQPF